MPSASPPGTSSTSCRQLKPPGPSRPSWKLSKDRYMANNLSSLLSPGPTGAAGLSPLYALGLKNRGKINDRKSLGQVCVEIEGVFLTQLLEQMRKSMVRGLKSSSPESQQYQALIDQHVARALAAGGGMGLARRLYEDLAQRLPSKPKEKKNW